MYFSKNYCRPHRVGCALWAVLCLIACSPCFSSEKNIPDSVHGVGNPTEVPQFESLDIDSDRYISFLEADRFPGLGAVFGDLDADRDGRLSMQEYRRFKSLEVDKAPQDATDLPKQ